MNCYLCGAEGCPECEKEEGMDENNEMIVVYKDGEECNHTGCKNHVTHPCEGCGRTEAKGELKLPKWLLDRWEAYGAY